MQLKSSYVTASTTKKLALELTKDFLENIDSDNISKANATFSQIGPTFRRIAVNSGCHAGFKDDYDWYYNGSQFVETYENTKLAIKFWSWITSKKSPWYKIACLVTPTYNVRTKFQTGWYVSTDLLKEIPFHFLKNFAILTRVFTEKYECIKIWELLVNNGIDEKDAFIICPIFYLDSNNNVQYHANGGHSITGWHWPLQHVDLKRFLSCDPKFEGGSNPNHSYEIKFGGLNLYKMFGLGTSIKTMFSTVNKVDLKEIIKTYNAIKKDYLK